MLFRFRPVPVVKSYHGAEIAVTHGKRFINLECLFRHCFCLWKGVTRLNITRHGEDAVCLCDPGVSKRVGWIYVYRLLHKINTIDDFHLVETPAEHLTLDKEPVCLSV